MRKSILSFLMVCTLFLPLFTPATAEAFFSSEDVTIEQAETLEEGTYKKGEVIATVISEHDTALTKENNEAYKNIHVEDTWNFGDAEFLAETKAESSFLSDKDYRVSIISSNKYTTEELISLLKKKAYVVRVEPNYYQKAESISNDAYVESQPPFMLIQCGGRRAAVHRLLPLLTLASIILMKIYPDVCGSTLTVLKDYLELMVMTTATMMLTQWTPTGTELIVPVRLPQRLIMPQGLPAFPKIRK